jgi:hypothetical protein
MVDAPSKNGSSLFTDAYSIDLPLDRSAGIHNFSADPQLSVHMTWGRSSVTLPFLSSF